MPDDVNTDWSQWSWLQDTYWYVPPESLAALQFSPDENTLTWRTDQTVWHISAFRTGYFWGISATVILPEGGNSEPSNIKPVCFSMIGSITPEGRIYITFVRCGSSSSRSSTTGIGHAVSQKNQWTMEMQMATGSTQTTIHWAYMAQVKPEDPSWKSLPGVGISVPQMLQGSEPPQIEKSTQWRT
jgi:hypothetical protein